MTTSLRARRRKGREEGFKFIRNETGGVTLMAFIARSERKTGGGRSLSKVATF